jgi:ribosome-binding protein aMBF1 (putative translation factor)
MNTNLLIDTYQVEKLMSADYTPVVWVKPVAKTAPKSAQQLAKAKAANLVQVQAKPSEVKESSTKSIASHKLDSHDLDDVKLPTTTLEFRLALAKARNDKHFTQKDLANKLDLPASTIAGYENGKLVPSTRIIIHMERLLDTKLPKTK